eukprot:TRINITY_DN90117_c0_g1_i1.p1 TRINITY_DN90117_c0_g1~~TRINITY_DN90117_c0_g1_i1.p1  ORF type:complete len:224 (+),score=50.84 TRINITY_DN90117_c0_g1_i1:151-822(+)
MASRPRPTKAPHIIANERSCISAGNDQTEDWQDSEVSRPSKECSRAVDSVKHLRGLVLFAKECDPSAFEGPMRFPEVAAAIEQHCGYSKKQLRNLLVRRLGCKGPAAGLEHHCSDLVTLDFSNAEQTMERQLNRKKRKQLRGAESHSPKKASLCDRRDPDMDMKGKHGPNGEAPEEGRWVFESKGFGKMKKWKWRRINEEKELRRAEKRAQQELEEAEEQAEY